MGSGVAYLPAGRKKRTGGAWLRGCLLSLAFLIPALAQAAIDQIEYFFDTDPGEGSGISLPVTPGEGSGATLQVEFAGISTYGLGVGTHVLFIRARDSISGWGPPRQHVIEISHPSSNIVAAELFVDKDPGEGNGIPLLPDDGAFDGRTEDATRILNDLRGWGAGAHTVYVRARNNLGVWGPPAPVFKSSAAPNVVVDEQKTAIRAEYFFDQDPGAGFANELILTSTGGGGMPATLDISGIPVENLPPGSHTFNLRVQDSEGEWGPVRSYPFEVIQTAMTLTAAEYFIDSDPGAGNGTPLAPVDSSWDGGAEIVSGQYSVGGLASGPHTLCIRGRDSNSLWGNVPAVPEYPMCGEFQVLANNQFIVSGTVRDYGTGNPLNGVTILVDGSSAGATRSDGSYSVAVSSGSRVFKFMATGYESVVAQEPVTANLNGYDISMTAQPKNFGAPPNQGNFADPVNTATGNYYYSRTDLEVPAPGISFEFSRYYNGQDLTSGILGFGWSHNLDMKVFDANGLVHVKYGDGRIDRYLPDGAGNFIPQPGVYNQLTFSGGVYTLRTRTLRQFRYDSAGRLIAIQDRNGNVLAISRDGMGRIATVMDPAGRSYTFGYDAAGFLASIADPAGRVVNYSIDAQGDLESVSDANGNTTRYVYDAHHLLLTVFDPRGNIIVDNVYDNMRRIVSLQRDAMGNTTSFFYDSASRTTTITDALSGTTIHQYDNNLRLIQETDPLGNSTTYGYDANNNRTSVIDKNGVETLYTYDANGNVTSKSVNLGSPTTPDWVTTRITYDAANNPLTRTDARGNTVTFQYDSQGNLTRVVDALGNTTQMTYDARGLLLTTTDARGNTVSNSYDAEGNLSQVTDSQGNITRYSYDAVGRRLVETDPLGNNTAFAYDGNDNLLSLVDPAGNAVSHTFDGNDNRISVTDKKGNATLFSYDKKDQLITTTDALNKTIIHGYDKLGRKKSTTDQNGNITRFYYDAAGNLEKVIDPEANTVTTAYDPEGRIIQVTNENGQATQFTYDKLGRLTQVLDAGGGVVQYAYDKNGNRISTTEPNGNVTTYQYDALNRLISKTEPLGNTTLYQYDAVGNLTRLTQPDGTVIQYAYDSVNRLSTVTYPDSSTVSFAYDANGNRIQMTDSLGTQTYQYDALNRMIAHADLFGQTVSYAYDANGNRTAVIYPDGKQVSYGYDALNRLTTVTDWMGNVTSYAYDNAGRLVSTSLPDGSTASYSYDGADRPVGLNNVQADSTVISSYSYVLDGAGNQISEIRNEPLPPFYMDRADTYTYDGENRMIAINGTANGFDANGNMTAKGTDSYSYDYENRLVQATVMGAPTTYQYDGLGNRYSRSAGGKTTRYVLDINNRLTNVLAETDVAGNITAYNIYGLGLIARILPDGTARYYHYDSRGSTIALTDASGAVTDQYAYGPFGKLVNSTGSSINPFTYLGRHGVMDEGNDRLYIRARYYDTHEGRFINKDVKPGNDRDGQSLNRYVYGLNNPIRLVDVSGFSPKEGVSDGALAFSEIVIRNAGDALQDQLLRDYVIINAIDFGAIDAGWIAGKGIPIARLLIDTGKNSFSLYNEVYQDPTINNYEAMSRWFLDLAVSSTLSAIAITGPWGVPISVAAKSLYDQNKDEIFNKFEDAIVNNQFNDWLGQKFYEFGWY